MRHPVWILAFAATLFVAAPADGKSRLTRKAEAKIAAEVEREYGLDRYLTDARCSRLTRRRWTCRWTSLPQGFQDGYDGVCEHRGKGRAVRFRFGWDARVWGHRVVYGC